MEEFSTEEVLMYIGELYLKNSRAMQTISMLKSQITEMQKILEQTRKERDDAIIRSNQLESENLLLRSKLEEYERDTNKDKKRNKE